MTRPGIVHGIRMMKGIMLTSSLQLLAQWHTTGSPCLFSVHCSGLECPRQSGYGQRDQRTASSSRRPCSSWNIVAQHNQGETAWFIIIRCRIRYRIMIRCRMLYRIRCRIRHRIQHRTYDWQETGKNVRHRTFFCRYRTLYIRCRTYEHTMSYTTSYVRHYTYDIVYDIPHTTSYTIYVWTEAV